MGPLIPMASSLQTLVKILKLEESKGYQNKAVIGGFARFAYHWSREAHSQAKTDMHHGVVDEITRLLREYEGASEAERPAMLTKIIELATSPIEGEGEDEGFAEVPEPERAAPTRR